MATVIDGDDARAHDLVAACATARG